MHWAYCQFFVIHVLISLLDCFPRGSVCPLYERDESVRVHSAGLSHDQTGDVGAGRGKSSPSQEGDLPKRRIPETAL